MEVFVNRLMAKGTVEHRDAEGVYPSLAAAQSGAFGALEAFDPAISSGDPYKVICNNPGVWIEIEAFEMATTNSDV